MYMGCKEGGGQPVDKAVGCTNGGQPAGKAVGCTNAVLAQYLCLVMEETEEPAVTTSSTWRGREGGEGGEGGERGEGGEGGVRWNNLNHCLSEHTFVIHAGTSVLTA